MKKKNIISVLIFFGLYNSIIKRKTYNKKQKTFMKDFHRLRLLEKQTDKRFVFEEENFHPCLDDNSETTGFDRHYVFHLAWAARILKKTNPALHYDISSYIYFSTIISGFIPIKFFDYRPVNIKISDFESDFADLKELPFDDNSITSLSCMHTIEHIGLGRYGDELDYDGDLKAINELQRVLARKGDLLIVVPVGKPKIHFNAHRVYSYDQIIDYFKELNLVEFSLIAENNEDTGWIENADRKLADQQNYGCGCFWFKK